MSIRIMTAAWDAGPESHAELLVLLALADFCNDEGMCFPSVPSIAKKARMSERNARRVIRKLEEGGFLDIEENRGRNATNRYWVRVGPAKPDNLAGLDKTGQDGPENRTPRAPKPDTAGHKTGHSYGRQTVIDPSGTVREPSAAEILETVVSPETAKDFIAHRKAMKKPVTAEAAKRLVRKVEGHPNPDAVFDESIANGWQGVFPERTKHGSRNTRDGSAADLAQRIGQEWEARNVDRGPGSGSSQPLLPARPAAGSYRDGG